MALRPGYKTTAIGVIPEDWLVVTLESITDPRAPIRYGVVQIGSDTPGGIPIVPIKFIKEISSAPLPRSARSIEARFAGSRICAGDVLLSVKGTIGRVGIVPDHFEGNIAREIARLRIKNEESPRFVMCQLEGNHTQRRINDAVVGTTRLEFSISAVRKFAIAVPSSQAERKEIACALSDIEDLTSALSHLIAKKRDLRQGAMQRLLTGQTRLPGFTAPWQEKRLGALGRFMKGSGVRRDEAQSGDIPCVRYGEIYTTHQNVVRHFASYISRAVAHSATRIQRGDILFAASGETKEEIGKCVALAHDVEAYAGGDIIILRPTSGDPVFLGYLLNTPHVVRQKANKGQGDAVVHIGALALAAIEISLPDENEQAAIAGVLSDMDAEISALETRLDKTLALKQAMMQALLTGRVRLPVRRDEATHTKEAAHA